MTDDVTTGPLRGIRVLDLADGMGLYCTKMLAGLGADVIKVEPPGGDGSRDIGPFYKDEPHREKSLFWFHFNANKRGITLNLQTPEGRELFKRLAATADIVVETSPPGAMEEEGIGWSALSSLNPRLIFASLTPFGQEGPWKNYQASDLVGNALGGLLNNCGWPGKAPEKLGGSQAYHMASVQATTGILMALYQRTKTGQGRHIDVSMHASVPVTLMVTVPLYERTGKMTGRAWNWHAEAANGVFPCKDGYIDFRLRLQRWDDFIRWLDRDGLAEELKGEEWKDPWFRQVPENVRKIDAVFCQFLLRHGKQELYEDGQKRGFEIGPAYTIPEVAASKQLRARNYFMPVEHPELGETLEYLGPPFRSSLAPGQAMRRAPLIGEHNESIYEEELGLSREQVIRLADAGVI